MSARLRVTALGAVAVLALAAVAAAVANSVIHAGPQQDGSAVTPSGWTVTPAGRQVDLADSTSWADRPFSEALSPDGRTLLVGSDGQSRQSLKVVDTETSQVRQTIAYTAPEALFVGLAFSPDGKRAYASAGGNNKVRRFDVDAGGRLTERDPILVPGFPAGLAVSADGGFLYVAENLADALGVVDLSTAAVTSIPLGLCAEDGTPVRFPTAGSPTPPQCQPYGVALDLDGRTVYVTNWGERSVSVLDVATRRQRDKVTVGTHPNALAVNPKSSLHELYVANGDSDTVSVLDTSNGKVRRTYDLAPYPGAQSGSNPNALSVSADGRTLYVANAGNNDVAVVSLERPGTDDGRAEGGSGSPDQPVRGWGAITGLIPTAWYPTGVLLSADGRRLYVANAKGLGAGKNPGYKQGQYGPPDQYVGSMMHGTLSIIEAPGHDRLEQYTRQVVKNNGFDERDKVRSGGSGESVIPRRVGGRSPIKHVIYVVKENRTYDQVFGSLGRGDGDPSLNLFGDDSAPNIRELARRFVTLDNFYASSEVSADGWNWSTAANANGYVQRSWPANYSDVNRGRGYDFEGGNYAAAPNRNPRDAYLWDRLAEAGVSFRNYGFYVQSGVTPATPEQTAPNLNGRTSPSFPGYNLAIADSPCGPAALRRPSRFTSWEQEFKQYEANGDLPSFEFVRLPNDHTRGTAPGAESPKRYVADNDYAVGRLVETVSASKYWSSTAIFIVEDDAQDGPDHIDGHRTEALVISPYTQGGKVDSTLYSTVSMLRTMELIVGLKPMTQFDAAATPMLASFASRPNNKTYSATVPEVLRPTSPDPECPAPAGASSAAVQTTNPANAPLAAQSAAMNFSAADAADNRLLNEAIWKSVRGAETVMPAPRNATFPPRPSGSDTDG